MSVENLAQLRIERGWTKVQAARALNLGVDVWHRIEQGAILPESLSPAQAERLAVAFGIEAEQFVMLLAHSHPHPYPLCRRKGSPPAEPIAAISFALALTRSAMTASDKRLWGSLETGSAAYADRRQT